MGDSTVTERVDVLQRGGVASQLLKRAARGIPGGERGIAAARGVCRSLVHHWLDDEHVGQMHASQLLVDDAFSRRALAELAGHLPGLVLVDVARDLAGDNVAARLSSLLKEAAEHAQAWAQTLARHSGDLSALLDDELRGLAREAREDLQATARAVAVVEAEIARRDAERVSGPGTLRAVRG